MIKTINTFAPSEPHSKQLEVLRELDNGSRFVLLRAGRKFRKTSLAISWLFEGALNNKHKGLTFPYIAPSRVQAKNICWDDHVQRILAEFKKKGLPYKTNETELSVEIKGGGKIQLYGVENSEALRGISNWGQVVCLDGDSLITMDKGIKKIKEIKKGDFVKTISGTRKVLNCGITGRAKELIEITLNTGEKLIGTKDHKIMTLNGFVSIDELRYNDIICTQDFCHLLNIKELNIDLINKAIIDLGLVEKGGFFIEKSIRTILVKLIKGLLFIIGMGIRTITILKTWLQYLLINILNLIPSIEIGKIQKDLEKCCIKIKKNLLNGLGVKRGKNLQEKTLKKRLMQLKNGMVLKRAKNFILSLLNRIGRIGKPIEKYVKSVEKNMFVITPKGQNIVPQVVEIKSLYEEEGRSVYNLTVNKDHHYFANNILVKNCDEYDDWAEDIYPLIIRPNLIPHKAPVLFIGTPKGKKRLWALEQKDYIKSFHFTSMDNPDIDPAELEALVKEYQDEGMDYYRQEILAEYIKPAGVVYREWDEVTNFIPLEYDPNLPLHITLDFGVNDPTAIIWIQPYQNETRVIDYYEASDANIEHFITYIRSRPYKPADLYTGDPAGSARTLTTGTSPIEIMADSDIHVRTMTGVKIPDQIRLTHRRMPHLYVSNKLERFRDCLLNYRYPEVKSTLRNQENEIPIHDEYSHAMRSLEYWCVNYFELFPTKQINKQIKPGSGAELIEIIESRRRHQESWRGWR